MGTHNFHLLTTILYPSQRHVYVLLCVHAYQGTGNWQISPDLVEIQSHIDATRSVCNDDVARYLFDDDRVPEDIFAGCSGIRGLHFVFVCAVCSVFCSVLRQAEKDCK